MKKTLKKALIMFIAAAIGSLGAYYLMAWMPNTTILVVGAGAAYIAYTKVK